MRVCLGHAVELKALLLGLSISSHSAGSVDDDVKYWMNEFDTDQDNEIDFEDFCQVLQK